MILEIHVQCNYRIRTHIILAMQQLIEMIQRVLAARQHGKLGEKIKLFDIIDPLISHLANIRVKPIINYDNVFNDLLVSVHQSLNGTGFAGP